MHKASTRRLLASVIAALVGMLMASPAAWAVLLEANWQMNDETSEPMRDSSGNNNNGIPTDVVQTGSTYLFNGSTSRVFVPDNDSLDPLENDITLRASVKVAGGSMDDDSYDIVRKGLSTTAGGDYKMEIKRATDPTVGKLYCFFRGTGGSVDRVAPLDIVDGVSHELACTKTNNSVVATVDGTSFTDAGSAGSIFNDKEVLIGAKTTNPFDDMFEGEMDFVTIDIALDGAPPSADTTAPTVSIATPPEGATYSLNQAVNADYTCAEENGGSGLASCEGPVPNGNPIDTSSTGTKNFTVTATDNAGNTNSVSHSYSVADGAPPPTTCTITGTSVGETLKGTSGPDVICGLGGNDTIKGLGGDDILKGEDGADKLFGGAGNDTLDGGLGTDLANFSGSTAAVVASLADGSASGEGSDTLASVERLTGSKFDDALTGSGEANTLTGGNGNDTLGGGGGNDKVVGSGGADSLFGDDDNDTLNSKDGVSGNDSLDGGPGTDKMTTDPTEASVVNIP